MMSHWLSFLITVWKPHLFCGSECYSTSKRRSYDSVRHSGLSDSSLMASELSSNVTTTCCPGQRRKFVGQSSLKSASAQFSQHFHRICDTGIGMWQGLALTRSFSQGWSRANVYGLMFTALFSPYKILCFSNPAATLSVVYDPISSHLFYSHTGWREKKPRRSECRLLLVHTDGDII